jgi:hypothetical protein
MVHELGHGFILEHPPADQFDLTVMGGHWNYPNTGLVDADRAFLGVSSYYPGFVDPVAPTVTIISPTSGAMVSGTVTIERTRRQLRHPHPAPLHRQPGEDAGHALQPDVNALGFTFSWNTSGSPRATTRFA